MIHRIIAILIVIPAAIILIALAVSNRAPTAFTIDPFNPGNPALTTEMPLFVWLFAALVVGMFIGSLATWLRQGRYRRAARENKRRQAEMRAEPARPASGTALIPRG
jgi:uncharacterized integral membrane protein